MILIRCDYNGLANPIMLQLKVQHLKVPDLQRMFNVQTDSFYCTLIQFKISRWKKNLVILQNDWLKGLLILQNL